MKNELPKMIRTLRKMHGLTQAQLAQRVGLHRTSITQIETGTQTITEPVLSAIAQALGYRVKIKFERLPSDGPLSSLPANSPRA